MAVSFQRISKISVWRRLASLTLPLWPPIQSRSLRSDTALEAIGKAAEQLTSIVALYNYPSLSGAFSALFAHLYHSRLNLPCLILPFSSVLPFRFLFALGVFFFFPSFLGALRLLGVFCETTILLFRVGDLCYEGLEECYFLDFVGPPGFAVELSRRTGSKVTCFDHRNSVLSTIPSPKDCPTQVTFCVDVEKSSSLAAYEHFFNELRRRKSTHGNADDVESSLLNPKDRVRVESILQYVEDGDLRRWKLPDIQAFRIGIGALRSSMNCVTNPHLFKQLLDLNLEELLANGKSDVLSRQGAAKNLLNKVFRVRLGRGLYGECLGVRADGNSHLSDELGKELSLRSAVAGLRPIGAVVYMQKTNLKMCLRSLDNATDTSEIAKAYGGGGSARSSSFMIRMDEYNQWLSVNATS